MERAKLSVLQTSVYKSVTELTSQYTSSRRRPPGYLRKRSFW
jgi:hypothetical protein